MRKPDPLADWAARLEKKDAATATLLADTAAFFHSAECQERLDIFYSTHCSRFCIGPRDASADYTVAQWEIYQLFQKVMDAILEGFVHGRGLSVSRPAVTLSPPLAAPLAAPRP